MMECEGGEIEKIANGRMYFEFGKLRSAIKYKKSILFLHLEKLNYCKLVFMVKTSNRTYMA